MNLGTVFSVTGKSGLFSIKTRNPNGVVVENLETAKTEFVASRGAQFSQLNGIAVYSTDYDMIPLEDVFAQMRDSAAERPHFKTDDDATVRAYFAAAVPKHDAERVRMSDMRRMLRWFGILNEKGLLADETPETAEDETLEEATPTANTEATA